MPKTLFSALVLLCLVLASHLVAAQSARPTPLRVGIAGLTHTHVHGILGRAQRGDIVIVGIAEPNRELARRYMQQYGLPMSLVYNSFNELLAKTKPESNPPRVAKAASKRPRA